MPHGMAVVLNNPSVWRTTAPTHPARHLACAHALGADARDATPDDAGEVLATRIIEFMRATDMPTDCRRWGSPKSTSTRSPPAPSLGTG